MGAFFTSKVSYPLDKGVISNFLNSTGPWSPCIIIGPASASLLSKVPPVIPSIFWFEIMVLPFATIVTRLPIKVISNDCHSPAFKATFSLGESRP